MARRKFANGKTSAQMSEAHKVAPKPSAQAPPTRSGITRHGLARVLSKLGFCSRTKAYDLIADGRVAVDGEVQTDAEFAVDMSRAEIRVDGVAITAQKHIYMMLNKPRGIVTSAADEKGRDTVYALLQDGGLPWIAPVGRLDRASEGLLLLSNDSVWAARITDPLTHLAKIYHVQIDSVPDDALLEKMRAGVLDEGDLLRVTSASVLRVGEKNAWLEITLDEGKNRHIRRLLAALEISVLRLMRVAIGELPLGDLAKGKWRTLDSHEVALLAVATVE